MAKSVTIPFPLEEEEKKDKYKHNKKNVDLYTE